MSKTARVYKRPNFDAEVIANLSPGKKLLGSVKNYEGTDGLGLFHKVRLKKGHYGYVLDTDIVGFKPRGLFSPKKKRGDLKSFGLTYAYMNESSLFGLKFTWKPLDVSLLASLEDSYFLDVSYQSIVMRGLKQEAYWSIGPALSYVNQLDIGVSAGLGWTYKFEAFLARLEGRYYSESYYALSLSVQRGF